jgi:deaminated glutathione amidase
MRQTCAMRVALLQYSASVDAAVNRHRVADRLAAAHGHGQFDLVVLPEAAMADFGPAEHDLASIAEPFDGPFVQMLAEHARRMNTTVVAGMFEATTGLPYNTVVVVGPDGQLAATYRKIHLYDSFANVESSRLSAGDVAPVVVSVAGVPVGLMTCYDLRFPELARLIVDAGATVMLVPAAWLAGEHKLHHWKTLATARAIENTVYVVAVGQAAPHYVGHSLVVDPWGTIVDEASSSDEMRIVEIDTSDGGLLAASRRLNPSLANRRIHTS